MVVVRGPAGGACPTFAPTDGTTYSPGAQGSDQIIYVGSAAGTSDTGLPAATTFCYEIFEYDGTFGYVEKDGAYLREVIYRRTNGNSVFTWNIMPVPVALAP